MLVHLGVLALVAVQLYELSLTGDFAGAILCLVHRSDVPLRSLTGVGGVAAAERREAAIAQLPDARHGRIEEGAVV